VPFWQLGGENLSPDGQKVMFNTEPGIKALEWLKKVFEMQGGWDAVLKLYQKVPPTISGASNVHFAEGRATHYYATFAERSQWFTKNAPDLKFGFTPWPKPPNGKDANYGGNHTFTVAKGSKNPDGAWAWCEWMSLPQNNLRFAKIYDRVPIRPEVARSKDYTEGDPFRELIAQQMPFRKFVIPAPGGTEIVAFTSRFIPDVMAGKVTIQEGLRQASDQIQQILDKWREKAKY